MQGGLLPKPERRAGDECFYGRRPHAWEGGGKFHSGIRINATEGLTHSMMGMADKTAKSIIEMPPAEHARRGNLPCRGRRLINLGRLSTGCEIMHISDRSARICSKVRTH